MKGFTIAITANLAAGVTQELTDTCLFSR